MLRQRHRCAGYQATSRRSCHRNALREAENLHSGPIGPVRVTVASK